MVGASVLALGPEVLGNYVCVGVGMGVEALKSLGQ